MIWTYNECLKKHKSDYLIKKAICSGELFKVEKGIYSDQPYASDIAVVTAKYPQAVISMNSAFYYHTLTDVVPDHYYLATGKDDSKIKDERVKQIFEQSELVDVGVTTMSVQGIDVKIYDKERMLIELIRSKKKLSYDYYKEIINRYRSLIFKLDVERIQEYAFIFPKSGMITETLQTEVF